MTLKQQELLQTEENDRKTWPFVMLCPVCSESKCEAERWTQTQLPCHNCSLERELKLTSGEAGSITYKKQVMVGNHTARHWNPGCGNDASPTGDPPAWPSGGGGPRPWCPQKKNWHLHLLKMVSLGTQESLGLIHKSVLYVCVSTAALQIDFSVSSF